MGGSTGLVVLFSTASATGAGGAAEAWQGCQEGPIWEYGEGVLPIKK